jgi:hypothetical protein
VQQRMRSVEYDLEYMHHLLACLLFFLSWKKKFPI